MDSVSSESTKSPSESPESEGSSSTISSAMLTSGSNASSPHMMEDAMASTPDEPESSCQTSREKLRELRTDCISAGKHSQLPAQLEISR
jgi:hypothetical protein